MTDDLRPDPALIAQSLHRRRFLGLTGAAAVVATGVLNGRRAAAAPAPAEYEQAFKSPRQIRAGELDVGYVDLGSPEGVPVLLLHGWPYDIWSFAGVAPILVDRGFRVVVPYLRGYGTTRFLSGHGQRNGQQAIFAHDMFELMDALGIRRAVVAGFDWGARTADIMAVLQPERVLGLVPVSGYLIGSQAAGETPLPPEAEHQWWYQFYFATERGALGYARNTHEFARLIWKLASPEWAFDEATFSRSAAALDNPDNVAITIHNYRWRLGLASGEPRFDADEARLATAPNITVPTITMEGDANGAPHPQPSTYASKFTGRYEARLVSGGIGHNLPQEAPADFARAVIDVAAWADNAG